MKITSLTSRQILDSRGHPTIETTVLVDIGVSGTAAVPSGASTGSHEAVELRDDNPRDYNGQSVHNAVSNVTGIIAKALTGTDVRDQRAIDRHMIELDGTMNKAKLGANAMLSVSLAVARAHAALDRQPLYRSLQESFGFPQIRPKKLPRPMMNVLNGGRHADNGLKVQEFMVIPDGATVATRVARGVDVYHALGKILHEQKLSTLLGDEGGYAPRLSSERAALDLLVKATKAAGYTMPKQVALGLDLAASEFYNAGTGRYDFGETDGGLASVGMIGTVQEWLRHYPLLSIEDPLAEDDWEAWTDLTATVPVGTLLVGDDLFATNKSRLDRGIDAKAANAILIKVNQIGTLTETMDTILRAQEAGYAVIISHRSGETTDSFIADLAVAVGAPWLKAGAPARGERVAKYNRLLAIEEELLGK